MTQEENMCLDCFDGVMEKRTVNRTIKLDGKTVKGIAIRGKFPDTVIDGPVNLSGEVTIRICDKCGAETTDPSFGLTDFWLDQLKIAATSVAERK